MILGVLRYRYIDNDKHFLHVINTEIGQYLYVKYTSKDRQRDREDIYFFNYNLILEGDGQIYFDLVHIPSK